MDEFDTFFARYPADVQAIGRKLRAMVKSALPQAHEVLVDRHDHIAYNFNESSASCLVYVCPLQNYVRLGFMYGTRLDDPEHLLIGEGKRLRHIKVWNLKDAGKPAFTALVNAAWADAETHLRPRVPKPGRVQP